ncbi:hypothetical protein [Mycolicibacterium neoaurum]|uniref:hypothetical protein n=1 Tax=Mycolicibacterium neoaurum TaxID=1795 RepID=UPI001F4C7814|nr:hypothetical protein [Mycolicibacterium neoaurum]
MPLELVDRRAEARSWTPFPSSDGYVCPHWWENAGGAVGDPWFVQVLEHDVEDARVQLDERGGINAIYPVTPAVLWGELLEIQYIDVASAARTRNVATRTVQALAERHTDRQLGVQRERERLLGLPRWMGTVQRPRRPVALVVPSAASVAVIAPVPRSRCQDRSPAKNFSTTAGNIGPSKSSAYSSMTD